MKICLVSGTFPDMRCGVGDYTYWLCRGLKSRGIELNVITSRDPLISGEKGLNLSPVIEKWNFSELFLLIRRVKRERPDLVHLQYPTRAYKNKIMINIFPVIFRFFSKIPLVVTVHDARASHPLNKLRLIPLLFWAKKIILTAEEERGYLLKIFPFLKSRFEVIPIGSNIKVYPVSPEEKRKIRLSLGLEDGDILIIHFGYILAKKKLEIIFYALRRLLEHIGNYKIRLVMLSEFNPELNSYHRRLERLVTSLGLDKDVLWSGYSQSEEVSRYLSAADIGIAIYQDGVSFRRGSFLACLSHGLATVTTKLKTLPEGLKDHDHLLAVAPNDAEGLTASLKELISSPELRKSLGQKAKAFSQGFSWEGIARRHIELYYELQQSSFS